MSTNTFISRSSSVLKKEKDYKTNKIYKDLDLLENDYKYFLILQILYENFEKQAIIQLGSFHLVYKIVVQDSLILLILVLRKRKDYSKTKNKKKEKNRFSCSKTSNSLKALR